MSGLLNITRRVACSVAYAVIAAVAGAVFTSTISHAYGPERATFTRT